MDEVRLSGQLLCKNSVEAELVAKLLPRHVELTRNEPGCLSFDVTPADDPLVWNVEEHFADPAAFKKHQSRGAASLWGRMTNGITREYTIAGLAD